MPSTPSLCGSFLGSKRSLLAFTWTVTTILTLLAFLLSVFFVIQIHSHYNYMEKYYAEQYEQNNNNDDDAEESNSADNENNDFYSMLAHTRSGSMAFCAVYTMLLALGLVVYGSTSIVGFTSLKGDYIAPCISSTNNKMRTGMFGGAIVMFANILLVCAVIFGEFRVEDYRENRDQEEVEPYAVEQVATVLGVTCMFLAVLYATFAILLFLAFSNDSSLEENDAVEMMEVDSHTKPLVTLTDRDQSATGGFITIDSSTSGEGQKMTYA